MLPSPSPDGAPIARVIHRVEWRDTDAAGIHHNTALTRYVEERRRELLRSRGIGGYVSVAPRVRYEWTARRRLRGIRAHQEQPMADRMDTGTAAA